MHWHPADAQTRCRPLGLHSCVRHAAEAAKQCWVCPGKEFVPFQAPSATYEADGVTYNLLIVEGKPTWIQQRDGGSLGAAGPGGTRVQADRNLVDGTILGRAPPKTDTAEEITMADVVPLNRRVDIRQEILSMEADYEALKVRERSRSRCSGPCRKLYHPQVDQAIRKKEELHKALREHREPTPEESSARQRHKELVTDEMLDNEMAILAPFEEVANEGARALRKVNLERFKAKLRDQYLEGKARHWLTSAPRTPTRHGCLTSPSRCRHGQMISGSGEGAVLPPGAG